MREWFGLFWKKKSSFDSPTSFQNLLYWKPLCLPSWQGRLIIQLLLGEFQGCCLSRALQVLGIHVLEGKCWSGHSQVLSPPAPLDKPSKSKDCRRSMPLAGRPCRSGTSLEDDPSFLGDGIEGDSRSCVSSQGQVLQVSTEH